MKKETIIIAVIFLAVLNISAYSAMFNNTVGAGEYIN
jgi:hypothetical protein